MKKYFLLITIATLVMAPLAVANPFSFDIGIGNTALDPYTGPFAKVDVVWVDSTHATITFTSLTNSGNIYLLGDGASVALNVNATGWTLGTLTAINGGTGFTPGPLSDGGSGNVSTFGVFNETINSFDGFTHSSDQIVINLTNTTGTWASDTDVLTANASGYLAGAHIFVTTDPANASNGALVTGFAVDGGGGGGPTIPEPTSLLLLGTGCATLALYTRRKKNH